MASLDAEAEAARAGKGASLTLDLQNRGLVIAPELAVADGARPRPAASPQPRTAPRGQPAYF